MKKIIIAVVGVIIVGGIGLPPLLGSMTENTVRTHIESWNDNPMFAFRVESYDRNWFTSSARIAVGVDPEYARTVMPAGDPSASNLAAAMVADFSLPFTLEVEHGPIVLSDGLFVGLSKMARVVDEFAHRPQVQERLTTQIAETMMTCTDAKGVAVVLEATHTCMTCRGIRKAGSIMVTSAVRGTCRSDARTRSEVMALLHR